MKKEFVVIGLLGAVRLATAGTADAVHEPAQQVDQAIIDAQNAALNQATLNKGYGPQSPRDITARKGDNPRLFSPAPPVTQMNLCNIHMHQHAEHKGKEFSKLVGTGDGHGFHTGFQYSGKLSKTEATPLEQAICPSDHGSLNVGDTIEVHYVHSTAQVKPGATLGACMSEVDKNPQLRVVAQVVVSGQCIQ